MPDPRPTDVEHKAIGLERARDNADRSREAVNDLLEFLAGIAEDRAGTGRATEAAALSQTIALVYGSLSAIANATIAGAEALERIAVELEEPRA